MRTAIATIVTACLGSGCVASSAAQQRLFSPRREAGLVIGGGLAELGGALLAGHLVLTDEPEPHDGPVAEQLGEGLKAGGQAVLVLLGCVGVAVLGGADVLAGLTQLVNGRYLFDDPDDPWE
jgi:hypothetical protein